MDTEPRDQAEPEAGPPREAAAAIDRAVHDFVEVLRAQPARAANGMTKAGSKGGTLGFPLARPLGAPGTR